MKLGRAGVAVLLASLFAPGFALGQGKASVSCTAEVGAVRAAEYLRQCREVSLASRNPCSAAKSCALLQEEIRRGCGLLGGDAPLLCRSYVDEDDIDEDEDE